jgi:2-polyprenyl-3-methyl-5-hydroxy-6-metoxy-1,4-benzoquinol methylase
MTFVMSSQSLGISADLFETIVCPLCGSDRMDVVRPSRYPAAITAQDISELYSASSAHILKDQVVRCQSCSLIYVNPRPLSELTIGSYASAVDPTFVAQNDNRIATFRKSLSGVLHRLGESGGNGRRLLDIGCAGGAFPVAARDLGFDPVGIEPSRWMADYARRTYGLDVRDGILEPGVFPPGSFDVVTLWDVIEHVPQPHDLLSCAHDLLKPGGLLLVNYPDVGSMTARMLGSHWPFWLSVHLFYYTRTTMARQLARAGYTLKWQEPCWPSLPAGYVVQRIVPYFRPAGWLLPAMDALRLSRIPLTYNMGQTLAVSRK